MRYLVIIEETSMGYAAYTPDLEDCFATGETKAEVQKMMKEAIDLHIEGLRKEGHEIPEPQACAEYLESSAWATSGQEELRL